MHEFRGCSESKHSIVSNLRWCAELSVLPESPFWNQASGAGLARSSYLCKGF